MRLYCLDCIEQKIRLENWKKERRVVLNPSLVRLKEMKLNSMVGPSKTFY